MQSDSRGSKSCHTAQKGNKSAGVEEFQELLDFHWHTCRDSEGQTLLVIKLFSPLLCTFRPQSRGRMIEHLLEQQTVGKANRWKVTVHTVCTSAAAGSWGCAVREDGERVGPGHTLLRRQDKGLENKKIQGTSWQSIAKTSPSNAGGVGSIRGWELRSPTCLVAIKTEQNRSRASLVAQ